MVAAPLWEVGQLSLTAEQLALRRNGVGSSEVAVLADMGRHAITPFDIWRAKVAPPEQQENKAMRRGRMLEEAVLGWYAEDSGAVLEKPGTMVHPEFPWVMATPDAIATLPGGRRVVVEAKTASVWTAAEWGPEDTDVPEAYLAQTAWEMFVTGLDRADLPVLTGGEDFRTRLIPRDDELIGLLAEVVERFWVNFVIPQVPPPVDYKDESVHEWLLSCHPKETSRKMLVPATNEQVDLALRLRDLETMGQETSDEAERLIARLKETIGPAAGITGSFGKITWLSNKDGTKTDWGAVAQDLFPLVPRAKYDEAVQRHTQPTKGGRTFRKRWAGEPEDPTAEAK